LILPISIVERERFFILLCKRHRCLSHSLPSLLIFSHNLLEKMHILDMIRDRFRMERFRHLHLILSCSCCDYFCNFPLANTLCLTHFLLSIIEFICFWYCQPRFLSSFHMIQHSPKKTIKFIIIAQSILEFVTFASLDSLIFDVSLKHQLLFIQQHWLLLQSNIIRIRIISTRLIRIFH